MIVCPSALLCDSTLSFYHFFFPSLFSDYQVTANLVRNYSPHIQPSVETAASTVDLKSHLSHQAKRMLLSYLRHWKRDRLLKGGANLPDRRLDAVCMYFLPS